MNCGYPLLALLTGKSVAYELELMRELCELAPSWRDIARRRLDNGTVEDFSPRLNATG